MKSTLGYSINGHFDLRTVSRVLGAFLVVWFAASSACRAGDWLTEPERDFFTVLGVDAQVKGKPVKRIADLTQLSEIASRAPQPLRGRIEAIAQANERMKVTPEEKAEFAKYVKNGQEKALQQWRGAVIGVLLGEDPMDATADFVSGTMKEAKATEVWDLQRKWIERGLAARRDADSQLQEITGELERRLGKSRPAEDLALSVAIIAKKLQISGKVGNGDVGQPVIQVKLYQNSTRGQWTGMNIASGALLKGMGVDAIDQKAMKKGKQLSVAQEQAMNLPLMTTILLPDLHAGDRLNISLGLPSATALSVDRVEARIWSGEGWFVVETVSGVPEAQEKAKKLIEEDQKKAAAAAAAKKRSSRQPSIPSRHTHR